jgi:hypothetical protein
MYDDPLDPTGRLRLAAGQFEGFVKLERRGMSWEEMQSRQNPCPCGQGHYVVADFMDDWNRTEERWTMECSRCVKTHGIYTTSRDEKGVSYPDHSWVPRRVLTELARAQSAVDAKQGAVDEYLRRAYRAGFHRRLAGLSRKAIWQALTDGGKAYPALGTFYKHVRDSGIDSVLDGYLEYRDVDVLVRILGIEDEHLDALRREVEAAQRAERAAAEHVQGKRFR